MLNDDDIFDGAHEECEACKINFENEETLGAFLTMHDGKGEDE